VQRFGQVGEMATGKGGSWRSEGGQGAQVARRSAGVQWRTGEVQVANAEGKAILGFRGREWAP
jgi:hypothetical protein